MKRSHQRFTRALHESIEMQVIYVLMHQSQQNYNTILDIVNHREDELKSQVERMDSLQAELRSSFQTLLTKLDSTKLGNNHIVVAENATVMSDSNDTTTLPVVTDHLISTVQNMSTLIVEEEEEGRVSPVEGNSVLGN